MRGARPKVTPIMRREIKRRARTGEPQDQIARAVGVCQATISRIMLGRRHSASRRKLERIDPVELSGIQIARLREAYADGVTRDQLSIRFGVACKVVADLTAGLSRGVGL